jgi:hypothetical protein
MVRNTEKMDDGKTVISVVIPIYRNESFIHELYSRLSANLRAITEDFEIIFVNDGRPDNSWARISGNAERDRIVKGIRFSRNFGQHIAFSRKTCFRMFYKFFDFLAGTKTDATGANFGIYSRKVIDGFNKMQEHSRLFPLYIRWLGFNTAYIDVEHAERSTGKSAYTLRKKLDLALDTIVAMSNKPLKISIKLGFIYRK